MATNIVYIWKRALKGLEFIFKRMVMFVLRLFLTTKGGGDGEPVDNENMRRVLFLRFDKLGDMVAALPVFETMSRSYPEVKLEVLASRANRILIEHDSRINRVWVYTKRPWRDIQTLWKLRQCNYDVIIDLICLDSVTSLVISQFVGRNVRRIGIGKNHFDKYYTHHVPLNHEEYEHIVDTTLKTLTHIGVERSHFVCQAPVQLPTRATEVAREFFALLGTVVEQVEREVIGVNISAGQPNRIWQTEKFSELIRELQRSLDEPQIVILCAPEDRARAEIIQRDSGGRAHLLPEGLNILDVSAIIARLHLLISPDTSLIHIARQCDVPVVGIYPTHGRTAAQWSPYGQTDGQVQGGSECNIYDITARQTLEEVRKVKRRIQQVTAK